MCHDFYYLRGGTLALSTMPISERMSLSAQQIVAHAYDEFLYHGRPDILVILVEAVTSKHTAGVTPYRDNLRDELLKELPKRLTQSLEVHHDNRRASGPRA
jgi:hypothetical protein